MDVGGVTTAFITCRGLRPDPFMADRACLTVSEMS